MMDQIMLKEMYFNVINIGIVGGVVKFMIGYVFFRIWQ